MEGMFQEKISSKEWVVVVVVEIAVEGRATSNPGNRLVCPTLKTVGSGFCPRPLPPFFNLFFRGAFALDGVEQVVMDWKGYFWLEEACLNEVGLQLRGADS